MQHIILEAKVTSKHSGWKGKRLSLQEIPLEFFTAIGTHNFMNILSVVFPDTEPLLHSIMTVLQEEHCCQRFHRDHRYGPSKSVVFGISLDKSPMRTEYAPGSHLLPLLEPTSSVDTIQISHSCCLFDPFGIHRGTAGDSKWRIFITFVSNDAQHRKEVLDMLALDYKYAPSTSSLLTLSDIIQQGKVR